MVIIDFPGKPAFWFENPKNKPGAGLNITIHFMNNDRKPDIIIANKNGVFLFENKMKRKVL